MNEITKQNRLEGWLNRPVSRRDAILAVLNASPAPLTARQVMRALEYSDMNSVRPRLTELQKAGRIRVAGKALDDATGRNTALYEAVDP